MTHALPGAPTLLTLGTVVAVLARPHLWWTAARQVRRLARPGWWRRLPFLPLPDRAYLRFRLETQYGDPNHRAMPDDVIAYLEWCRREHAVAGFR